MLIIHFVVIIMISVVFTLIAIFHRDKGPIPPLIAFISWISAAYQSVAIELPYATTSSPITVWYEPYTGGAALGLYFMAMAAVMFIYFAASVFDMVRGSNK